jgi:signal transduction histidine kinase
MSIVKEIMELHGGQVEIQSQLGAGTSVTLWLTAASAPV